MIRGTSRTPAFPPIAAGALAALIALCGPGTAGAQIFDPPTLADRGIRYVSPSGFLQVQPSGRFELEGFFLQDSPPWLIPETGSFAHGRLSLFADIFAGEHTYALVELRADRGEAPADGSAEARIEQAFLRLSPWKGRDLHLQAGKFASPFTGFGARHHTPADPFIRPPLSHEYRTLASPVMAPGSVQGFSGWKNAPPGQFRPIGAPIIWAVPYQFGAMAFGSVKGVTWRVAALNSAPSSEPDQWDPDFGQERAPSWVAGLGWQPAPELSLAASYDRGPYMSEDRKGPLPAGTTVNDFEQEIWGFEAAFQRGRTSLRGELLLDRWEVGNVGDDVRDTSYFLEGKLDVSAGLYAALRYGAIHFNDLTLPGGGREPWDYDARRWQLAAGYRLGRNSGLRLEYALNHTGAPVDPRDDLFAVQWWWGF